MTTRRPLLLWLACVLGAPLVFTFGLMAADRSDRIDPALRVADAWLWTGDGMPPLAGPRGAGWTRIAVPRWEWNGTGALRSLWVRLEPTPAQRDADRLALYAPQPSSTLDLYVDGTRVATGGRTTPPVPYHQFPLLFTFAHPPGRDAAIVVNAVREGQSTWIPDLWLGPVPPLAAAADARWWFVAGVPRIAALFAVCFALLAFGFHSLKPGDHAFAWFGGAVVFWLAHLARDHVPGPPMGRPLWVALTNVALGAFVWCAIVFVHRFVGHEARRLERGMRVVLVAGAALLVARALVTPWQHGAAVTIPWVLLVNMGGLYLVWRLARASWHAPDADRLALLAAASATSGVGIRDFLYDFDVWPVGSGFYLGHALALVVIVFGTIMVRRFAGAVDRSERLNDELRARIRDKTAELDAQHARLSELEAETTRREERERLTRELHDGLGGQLVQGIAVAARGGDAAVLGDIIAGCLRDLDALSRVDGGGRGPATALVRAFCARSTPRLAAAGVALGCRVDDAADTELDADASADVLGILQEAVTNALKHGRCRRIDVALEADGGGALRLAIRDDGVGPDGRGAGHGIAGMRERARRLGGTIDVAAAAPGTSVVLTLGSVA